MKVTTIMAEMLLLASLAVASPLPVNSTVDPAEQGTTPLPDTTEQDMKSSVSF